MPEPSAALSHLAERLHIGAERILHLERLGEAVLEEFGALVSRAQIRDEQEIEEGFQKTLRFVPRLLRGRVQKMLFPEDDK